MIYAEIASRHQKADSKDVLVIGLGKVGFPGAAHFVHKGFRVYGYDADEPSSRERFQTSGLFLLTLKPKKVLHYFRGDPMCKYSS